MSECSTSSKRKQSRSAQLENRTIRLSPFRRHEIFPNTPRPCARAHHFHLHYFVFLWPWNAKSVTIMVCIIFDLSLHEQQINHWNFLSRRTITTWTLASVWWYEEFFFVLVRAGPAPRPSSQHFLTLFHPFARHNILPLKKRAGPDASQPDAE